MKPRFRRPGEDDYLFPSRHYDRLLTVGEYVIAWRWRPFIRWRYFPRAWGDHRAGPGIEATNWTGRNRELIAVDWPFTVRKVLSCPPSETS